MSDRSKIEWCDATWNPLYGCTRVSEGCRNCYAEGLAARFHKPDQWGEGLTKDGRWTGKVTLAEHRLTLPLKWRKPRRIFVNSASDLFHEAVPDAWIDRVFAVMALCPQHTFQILSKRPGRMQGYLSSEESIGRIANAVQPMRSDNRPIGPLPHVEPGCRWWPLPNVWLGVSVENQQAADERIPDLLATPAAVRIVSAEPLLGPVDMTRVKAAISGNTAEIDALTGDVWYPGNCGESSQTFRADLPHIDGVIVGGESGPRARPMHPDWARSLRDQCAAAGVPFFFKQWGEWAPEALGFIDCWPKPQRHEWEDAAAIRIGKASAGRLLDGRTHDDLPPASKDAAE